MEVQAEYRSKRTEKIQYFLHSSNKGELFIQLTPEGDMFFILFPVDSSPQYLVNDREYKQQWADGNLPSDPIKKDLYVTKLIEAKTVINNHFNNSI